jgi:hypothetical protein
VMGHVIWIATAVTCVAMLARSLVRLRAIRLKHEKEMERIQREHDMKMACIKARAEGWHEGFDRASEMYKRHMELLDKIHGYDPTHGYTRFWQ